MKRVTLDGCKFCLLCNFFFNFNANNEYTARIFRRAVTVWKLLISLSLSIGQTIAILKFCFPEAVENKENPLGPSSLSKKNYMWNWKETQQRDYYRRLEIGTLAFGPLRRNSMNSQLDFDSNRFAYDQLWSWNDVAST